MKYYQNILETIGNTPMVKVQKITIDLPCPVLIKMETFNPGHSIKDRMALKMLLDAEAGGMLKPGGIMYVSMKAWGGSEKGEDGRVFQLWSDSELRREFGRAGLDVLEHSRSRSLLGNRDVWLGYILQADR